MRYISLTEEEQASVIKTNPFYAAINAKLAEIVESTSPIWSEGWEKLGPTALDGERLAVYQALREAGSLPEAASVYLVRHPVLILG